LATELIEGAINGFATQSDILKKLEIAMAKPIAPASKVQAEPMPIKTTEKPQVPLKQLIQYEPMPVPITTSIQALCITNSPFAFTFAVVPDHMDLGYAKNTPNFNKGSHHLIKYDQLFPNADPATRPLLLKSINSAIKQDRILELHYNNKDLIRISTDMGKKYIFSDAKQHYLIYADRSINPSMPCDFCLREDGTITQTAIIDEMGLDRKTSVVSKIGTLEAKNSNSASPFAIPFNAKPWELTPPHPKWIKGQERER